MEHQSNDNNNSATTSKQKNSNDSKDKVYFERQSFARCAVHAVNNLLQEQAFTRQDFDNQCELLTSSSFGGYIYGGERRRRRIVLSGTYNKSFASIAL
jgi:hypothetical protein